MQTVILAGLREVIPAVAQLVEHLTVDCAEIPGSVPGGRTALPPLSIALAKKSEKTLRQHFRTSRTPAESHPCRLPSGHSGYSSVGRASDCRLCRNQMAPGSILGGRIALPLLFCIARAKKKPYITPAAFFSMLSSQLKSRMPAESHPCRLLSCHSGYSSVGGI